MVLSKKPDHLLARKRHYMQVRRLTASLDGNLLGAADNLGRLVVFSMAEALCPRSVPLSHAYQMNHPILAMAASDNLLLCGDSHGRLLGFAWQDLSKPSESGELQPVFSSAVFEGAQLSVPGPHEVNGMKLLPNSDKVVIGGAGDNSVRIYDLHSPSTPISIHAGHSDYVTEIAVSSSTSFLSASADGTVRIWDTRQKEPANVIRVADELKVSRPSFGHCISALAVDGPFMVCGGGVDLGIWHLGSLSLASVLESTVPDIEYITVEMKDDRILAGGSCNRLEQWDYAANSVQSVETKAAAIHSIMHTEKATFTSGDSPFIDVFLNLGYVSSSLDVLPMTC